MAGYWSKNYPCINARLQRMALVLKARETLGKGHNVPTHNGTALELVPKH